MSCNSCGQSRCRTPNSCFEARLSLGLNEEQTQIVGTLDGLAIIPIDLKGAVRANETDTSLKWDDSKKQLVYKSERGDAPDTVSAAQILSGAQLSQIGGIGNLVEGGLASIQSVDDVLQLVFEVPEPVAEGELSEGFIAYVPDPISGSRYKIIKPAPGGDSDTLLVGHPDGSIEFVTPIVSPLLVAVAGLTSAGKFSGNPAISHGDYGFQTMGSSQVVSNTSNSSVEVILSLRYELVDATATVGGIYCNLVNGGADFQTLLAEGVTGLKQTGLSGYAEFRAILEPNQKVQFEFGGWADHDTGWDLTIGTASEDGTGTPTKVALPPVITIRRLT